MDTKRIDIFKEFASYIEYPMVVFEAESGKVLDINYEAEVLIGKDVKEIHIEPGRAYTKMDFWNALKTKKSLIWHRIRMRTDDKEHLVSGLINEMVVDDRIIYAVLFELRADMNIGSLTLERIINHGKIVALHVSVDENGKRHVEYASQNINQYGYTRVQLYDKGMVVEDMVCPEDLEYLIDEVRHATEKHLEESSLECRVLTEEKELIPVRILFHYNYNDEGRLTDYEVLAVDRKAELEKADENEYLNRAVSKMKSVVMVKSYHAGKRSLKYISPNAGILGMNVDALKKGNKLTEDYIHPEDRDSVIDLVYQAVAGGVSDYEHTYRMVRDDGKQIWVDNQVTVNRISDGEAEISFLLTDISEQKEMEERMEHELNSGKAGEQNMASPAPQGHGERTKNPLAVSGQLQLMAESIGRSARYYIAAIGLDGKMITNPVGPSDNIGIFYDLFERPELKQQFAEIAEQAKLQKVPKSLDIHLEEMPVYMIFAPLQADGDVKAFWVLASLAGNDMEVVSEVVEAQWQMANMIIESFYAEDRIESEIRNRKMMELKYKREQQERHILQKILDIVSHSGDSGLGEICHKISLHLSVSHIGIYVENSEDNRAVQYFVWNQGETDHDFFDAVTFSETEFLELEKYMTDQRNILAKKGTTEPFLKELLDKTQMRMIAMELMVPGADQRGYILFADENRENGFDEKEQHFVNIATKLIQELTFRSKPVVRMDLVREGFLETYDHVKDAVFVKDNNTGEIVFANKAMDKLFGYSIIGMQAQDIVNDQMEQYRQISGMRKRFIANNKVSKWQCYLKELDQIMNVVEVRLSVFSGTDLSLVILKKNKNK